MVRTARVLAEAANQLKARRGLAGTLTAMLLFAASPGVDVWPAAFIALIPLMLVVEQSSFRRALLEGFVSGVLVYALGLSWFPESFNALSNIGSMGAWASYVAIVVVSSTKLALATALSWLLMRARVPPITAFTLGFAASELSVPSIVPYSMASSLYLLSPLLQVSEWGGSNAIVAALAALNATLAKSLTSPSWRESTRYQVGVLVLVGGWLGGGYWLRDRARSRLIQSQESSRVLIVEPDLPLGLKQTKPSRVLSLYRQATKRAMGRHNIDWVVWGETALASAVYGDQLDDILGARLQGGIGVPLLTGVAIQGQRREQHNSAVLVDATGRVCESCRYDKRRLVPFIESASAFSSAREQGTGFSPGSDRGEGVTSPFRVRGHPVAIAICYEALYATEFRGQVLQNHAELLVSLASDLWLRSERAKRLHLAMIQLRAIEHRRFLVHATQGGDSALIDPTGHIETKSNDPTSDFMIADVIWLRDATLWTRLGDLPFWVTFCLIAANATLRKRTAASSHPR